MKELLTLCGYQEPEIKSELPRVEKAFQRLGLTAEDIEPAKQRLNLYYDTELMGVRKALRLCVMEVVDSILARDEGKKKLIYGFMAPGFNIIGSALVSNFKEVYSVHHSWALQFVVGCIFGKMVPMLEAAENKWLKAGAVAHCSNVKGFLGPLVLDAIPKPDMAISSGFLCETAPKMLDLLEVLYDIPICCTDTCQDRDFSDYAETTRRSVDLGAKSFRKLFERIHDVLGSKITDDMLSEMLKASSSLDNAVSRLRSIIDTSDPLPLSATHENLWRCITQLTMSLDKKLPEAVDAINTVCEELQERVNKGQGAVEKGAPRILGILPDAHADPRLEHLLGEVGIAMVACDTNFSVPRRDTAENPYMELVMRIQHTSLTSVIARRIPLIIEGCKRLKVNGVLNRFHVGCRAVAGDALLIQNAVEKELGIPVLLLEWENFDPRVYNHEEFKRRLEVFKSMMIARAK